MRVIADAVSEQEVLLSTSKDANSEQIRESIINKAQTCVDHLCGCS